MTSSFLRCDRNSVAAAVLVFVLLLAGATHAQGDPLSSWNDGPAKQTILNFVKDVTDKTNPKYVEPQDRIATFDQDGTLWVEHPVYTQVAFALDRVVVLAPKHPEWRNTEPFKSVLTNDKAAMAKFTLGDFEKIIFATHTGMTVEEFNSIAKDWIVKAKNPRWNRPYTELVYQPMLELMSYLRTNGFKTYIVTGGGQDFVPPMRSKRMESRPSRLSARHLRPITPITRRAKGY
jgi:haloacid dehalogenase-like hydrolase